MIRWDNVWDYEESHYSPWNGLRALTAVVCCIGSLFCTLCEGKVSRSSALKHIYERQETDDMESELEYPILYQPLGIRKKTANLNQE